MPILKDIEKGLWKRGFLGFFLPEPLYRWFYPLQQQHSQRFRMRFKTICSIRTVQLGATCIATLTLGVSILSLVFCMSPLAPLLLPALSYLPFLAAVVLVSIIFSCAASIALYLLISLSLAKQEDNTFIDQGLGLLQFLAVGAMLSGLVIIPMLLFLPGVSLFLPLGIGISTFCVGAGIFLGIKTWFAYKEGTKIQEFGVQFSGFPRSRE